MVYQGTNKPIKLQFDYDMRKMGAIKAALIVNDTVQKEWSSDNENDMTIYGIRVDLLQNENETLRYDCGRGFLEVKYLSAGLIQMVETVDVEVVKRYDERSIQSGYIR